MKGKKAILTLSILISLIGSSNLFSSSEDCDIFAPQAFSVGNDLKSDDLKELAHLTEKLKKEERTPAGNIQDFSNIEEDINRLSEIFSKNNSNSTIKGSM